MSKNKEITLRAWIEAFNSGAFDAKDFTTQCEAGWYDWFCSERALRGKLYRLAPKVKQIAKSPKIDIDKVYVWFKNNCPMDGELYDDFRISDIESSDTVFTFTPSSGHTSIKGRSEIWAPSNGFNGPIVTGKWQDVLKYMEVI